MSKEQDINQANKSMEFDGEGKGEVLMSADVVASIAALAAVEIDGVHSTVGSLTNEIAGKLGVKNLSKGVKATIEDEEITIDMNIIMDYGYNILKTCKQVQERVVQSVESMTGLKVIEVNIRIADVAIEKE